MAEDSHPRKSDEQSSEGVAGAVLGYLLAGIVVWGFLGWLVEQLFGLRTGIGIAVGMIFGAAGAIYLIMKRLSA
jgi:F0F1-type ATP synthase assembly protein I